MRLIQNLNQPHNYNYKFENVLNVTVVQTELSTYLFTL